MGLTQYLVLAGILCFAGASFFFAVAESALFALGKWQANQLAEEAPERGKLVRELLHEPSELLATIVLGNTLANGLIVALGLSQGLTGVWPLGWVTALLLLGVVVGCEVWPKTLAVRAPKRWALRVARPMMVLRRVTHPLHRLVEMLDLLLLQRVLRRAVKPIAAQVDEEYKELLELAFQHGALGAGEKEIILEILSLDQKNAGQVMTPVSQMKCLPVEASVEDMVTAARRYKHRRLPLFDGTPDTIAGVLDTKILLLDPHVDLAEAIELPSFVPASMNLLQLMKSLQRQRRGLAVVLNEFGHTAGLITLQNILEEMVGPIFSEGEARGFVMEKLGEDRWRVSGTMRLDDFRREYPGLGEGPGVDTLGGLMTTLREVVPAVGETVLYQGLKLTVLVADDRRVIEALIEVKKKGTARSTTP